MDIINIPIIPDVFLDLPAKSHISLFYERINFPFESSESKKWKNVIFRIANIQLSYTADFLDWVIIYFTFEDRFIFKFNSIVINGNSSDKDLKQILLDGKIEYTEDWSSEDQFNIYLNKWATFIFDIGPNGTFLQKISLKKPST